MQVVSTLALCNETFPLHLGEPLIQVEPGKSEQFRTVMDALYKVVSVTASPGALDPPSETQTYSMIPREGP